MQEEQSEPGISGSAPGQDKSAPLPVCPDGSVCRGTCVADRTYCDDNDPCTTNDKKVRGQCMGTPIVCPDGKERVSGTGSCLASAPVECNGACLPPGSGLDERVLNSANLACGSGVCAGGVTQCSQNGLVCQTETLVRTETCNAMDDDCDGDHPFNPFLPGNIDSGEMPSHNILMLRARIYNIFCGLLLPNNQYRAIVDRSFHSVSEWVVRPKRFSGPFRKIHKGSMDNLKLYGKL